MVPCYVTCTSHFEYPNEIPIKSNKNQFISEPHHRLPCTRATYVSHGRVAKRRDMIMWVDNILYFAGTQGLIFWQMSLHCYVDHVGNTLLFLAYFTECVMLLFCIALNLSAVGRGFLLMLTYSTCISNNRCLCFSVHYLLIFN